MFPIAIAAGALGFVLLVLELAGQVALPRYVSGLTLIAGMVAFLACRGGLVARLLAEGLPAGRARTFADHLARPSSTLIRAVIGFLVVWNIASVLTLLLGEAGLLPQGLGPYLPTRASVLFSAVFALITYGVSFLKTVRQVTGLADPYFEARETGTIDLPFGWRLAMAEGRIAHLLLFVLLAINVAQVVLTVVINEWNNRFYTAMQQRNETVFWIELRFFTIVAFIWVIGAVYELYLTQYAQIRWRRWLTARLTERWIDAGAHYRMRLTGSQADNPDQRIAEDARLFASTTYELTIRFFSAALSLYSFVIILWGLSRSFTYRLWGFDLASVPGYLVWGALIFAVIGTVFAHLIGRSLIRINFERQRYEADFRFNLVRVRENDEQIALLAGEPAERQSLGARFARVVLNWYEYMTYTKRLTWFTSLLGQTSIIFPYVMLAPAYFSGAVEFGAMMQTASAFGRVESAMLLFTNLYGSLADYKSVLDRLSGFEASAEAVRRPPVPRIAATAAGDRLELQHLTVTLPDGTPMVAAADLAIAPGERVLVTGPSGAGKSTLFRAIAGIWPYGSGAVTVPAGARLMLLPQRPYFPVGTLRQAITYPAVEGSYSDGEIATALTAVRLPALAGRLNEEAAWHMILSGGEQQRLAMARALLSKPDWLFLDEATAAIDEAGEAALYATLGEWLPNATVVSIGHRSTLANFHDRRVHLVPGDDGLHVAADAALMPLAKA